MTIFFWLNNLAESRGSIFTITGGSESLGPPVGGTMLAHPGPDEITTKPIITTARADK